MLQEQCLPGEVAASGCRALRALGGADLRRARAAAPPAARHRARAAAALARPLDAGVRGLGECGPHLPRVPSARARVGRRARAAAAAAGAPGRGGAARRRLQRHTWVRGPERVRARSGSSGRRGRRRTGAAVAVPAGGAGSRRARHLLGGSSGRRRVPAGGPGRGGAPLGAPQAEAQHELRQAVPRAPILLRQEYYEQGARQEIRVPVQLGGAVGGVPGAGARRAALLALPGARAAAGPPDPAHHALT